jgi:hypothetical protein
MITRFVLPLAAWAVRTLDPHGARARAAAFTPTIDRWEREAAELAARIVSDEADRQPKPNALRTRRLATGLTFVSLFFAGAALSAGAGETVVDLVGGSTETGATSTGETTTGETTTGETTTGETTTGEADPADAIAVEPAPITVSPEAPPEVSPAAPTTEVSGDAPAPPPASAAPAASPDPVAEAPAAPPKSKDGKVRDHDHSPSAGAEPEIEDPNALPTVWLHRVMPDPTPPARRLRPAFAKRLRLTAASARVDWQLLLGYLRAEGRKGKVPASPERLRSLADQLVEAGARKKARRAVIRMTGRELFADTVIALRRYNRAVRLRALVRGLKAVTPRLEKRLLADERVDIYAGGRADVEQGKIDVRVLVLMLYLAEAHGQVTVSSLESGHRLYSRPGVISAHIYGLAVDIAGLNSKSIFGNQEPGGLTERAVRNILLLPAELQPQQVISLLGFGGPSFALGDHGDHIHVGY